jgi:hypothetical protein
MTVDDDCSCQCYPPQEPYELASDQPGVSAPRVPPTPPALPPVVPAPPGPPPPPPPPPPVVYTNPAPDDFPSRPDVDHDTGPRPVGPQDNPNRPGLTLICPGDISVSTFDVTGEIVDFSVSATSGCSPVSLAINPPSGTKFPIGTTLVSVEATDSCAHVATCSFHVNVALSVCPPVSGYPTITLSGAANTLAFDSVRRIVYAGAGGGTTVTAFSTATQSVLASYTTNHGFPSPVWSMGYDALHNCLVSVNQSGGWSALDLGTGVWTFIEAIGAGTDAGNFRQMTMDSADGLGLFIGINNGTNSAIQLVQINSSSSATNLYSSGYILPLLGENPCYSKAAGKFLVSHFSGGAPSFYYVNKLTGALTASALSLGNLFGAILSVDSLGIVVVQGAGGVISIVDPVTDTLLASEGGHAFGFLIYAAEYNSCSKLLYVSDNHQTLVFDPSNSYAYVQTIAAAYLDLVFDPYAGLMFAANGTNLVTTF